MHQEAKTYRQTKNLLVRRSSLLDGGHLYAMGDLAESWEEEKNVWTPTANILHNYPKAEQEGKCTKNN